jgi:hypothetical protein
MNGQFRIQNSRFKIQDSMTVVRLKFAANNTYAEKRM